MQTKNDTTQFLILNVVFGALLGYTIATLLVRNDAAYKVDQQAKAKECIEYMNRTTAPRTTRDTAIVVNMCTTR